MSLTVMDPPAAPAGRPCGAWLLSGHTRAVRAAAADGAVFATCDSGGAALLWSLDAAALSAPSAPSASSASSAPSALSASSAPAGGARHAAALSTGGPAIADVCFFRHTRLCAARGDGAVGVWDVETGRRECALRHAGARGKATNWPVVNTVTEMGGGRIAFGGDDGFVVIGSPLEQKTVGAVNLKVPITAVAAATDFLFVGDVLGTIRCLDLRTLKTFYSFRAHRDVIGSLALNEDARMMVSYGMDNSLGLWDIQPFALSPGDRSLQRTSLSYGDSRDLLRCSWSGKEMIAVPTSDGSVMRLKASNIEGSKEAFPARHSAGPVTCATLINDNVLLSAAGSEVMLQYL